MINFIIPGLYELNQININLLYLLKYCPVMFEENIKIGAVFGAFQYNIWDGGRVFNTYRQASRENIEFLKHIYNDEFNIPMRFVFTNSLITQEDCYDHFNNMVLEICHNEMNEVVISSPILCDYIQKNYPKYKIISSTTKCLVDKNEALQEIIDDKYCMTCIDYNLNKNQNFLNSIPIEERKKVEILINAICPPGCPNRKEHYRLNSIFSLTYGKEYRLPECGIVRNTLDPIGELENNLSKKDIYETYSQMGFINFKIEGRTLKEQEIALNYVKYMVKDKYKELATFYLLSDTQYLLKKLNIQTGIF